MHMVLLLSVGTKSARQISCQTQWVDSNIRAALRIECKLELHLRVRMVSVRHLVRVHQLQGCHLWCRTLIMLVGVSEDQPPLHPCTEQRGLMRKGLLQETMKRWWGIMIIIRELWAVKVLLEGVHQGLKETGWISRVHQARQLVGVVWWIDRWLRVRIIRG